MKIKSDDCFNQKSTHFRGIIEFCDGMKYNGAIAVAYYKNGKLHRENDPAVEWATGTKSWLMNDAYHRIDGPAIEYGDGKKEWWINGKNFLQEENWKLKIEKFRKNGLASK